MARTGAAPAAARSPYARLQARAAATAPLGLCLVTVSHQHSAASGGIPGWLEFISGALIGALTIVSAIVIAWWQRVIELRDRAADRAEEAARQQELDAREAKVARREMWRAEYDAIQKLLECCEELAYHVRHEGPCTAAEFAVFGVATLRMNSERLAERNVPRLRDPLLQLAGNLDRLVQQAIMDEITLALGNGHGRVLDRVHLHDMQRTGILQDRAERELAVHIASTWQLLRTEWGI